LINCHEVIIGKDLTQQPAFSQRNIIEERDRRDMEEIISRLLQDLSSSATVDQGSTDTALEPQTLVANIFSYLSVDEDFHEKASRIRLFALLFDSESPPSLLKYLTATMKMKDREIIKSKVDALKKIGEMMKFFPADELSQFIEAIFQTAFDVYCRDESSDVRAAAFSPIKNILRSNILASNLNFSLANTYSTLLESLIHDKKLSKGVKSEILKTLGLLAMSFPDSQESLENADKVVRTALAVLEKNFDEKSAVEPEFSVIAGSYSCLDRFLYSFSSSVSSKSLIFLGSCILKSIIVASKGELSRYEMCSKALRLLKNHSTFFRKMIASNINQVHSGMSFCSKSMNKALVKHSSEALHASLSQFSKFVLEEGKKDSIDAMRKIVTLYTSNLSSTTTTSPENDILFSVNVISAIAPAIMIVYSGAESLFATTKIIFTLMKACSISDSFTRVVVESDNTWSEQSELSKIVYKKSLYLLAVVSIAQSIYESSMCLDHAESDHLQVFLCNTACEIVDGYINSTKKQKVVVKRALGSTCRLFCTIPGGLSGIGKPILNKLVIRAISRSVDFTDSDYTTDGRLYRLYADLLNDLLNPLDSPNMMHLRYYECSSSQKKQKCFDLCMDIALEIFNAFDLSYIRNSEDASYLAKNIADQEFYLNYVSFFEILLPNCLLDRFLSNWIEIFMSKILQIVTDFEMISSSYRFAKLCMITACSRNCLTPSFVHNIQEFVEILHKKVSHFEGELLMAVLDFLLHIPASLLQFKYALPIIEVSFCSRLKCADAFKLIDQYILAEVPEFFEIVDQLLPHINSFLVPRSRSISSRTQSKSVQSTVKVSRSKSVLGGNCEDDCIEFMAVRLLGRLGGKNQKILQSRSDDTSATYWNPDTVFSLELQCSLSNQAIEFHLEGILPVILQLSLNASDRHTKILACESLHSMILYMIGASAMDPQRTSRSRFSDNYAVIFPNLISLSSSTDTITREMFSKLLFQVIHWFSGQGHAHPLEVTTLIESLLEGSCNISDLSIRDRCAQGLYEFFSWSIKQTSPKELEESSGGIDTVVSRYFFKRKIYYLTPYFLIFCII